MNMESHAPIHHLHVGFNQDNGCFAVGESAGFRIFNTHPFNEQVCMRWYYMVVRMCRLLRAGALAEQLRRGR